MTISNFKPFNLHVLKSNRAGLLSGRVTIVWQLSVDVRVTRNNLSTGSFGWKEPTYAGTAYVLAPLGESVTLGEGQK